MCGRSSSPFAIGVSARGLQVKRLGLASPLKDRLSLIGDLSFDLRSQHARRGGSFSDSRTARRRKKGPPRSG